MEGAVVKPKSLLGKIFEPTVDFYALMNKHADKTLEGMRALVDWLEHEDSAERCQTVRDLETEADTIKFDIAKKLVESFITPMDREDIYDLSQRMDEVINSAKGIAREIEAFETKPSKHPEIIEMAAILVDGTQSLVTAIAGLKNQHEEAQKQAILACKSSNKLNKCYRRAVQNLLQLEDVKVIFRVQEVYKAMITGGEKIDLVGERLLHALMKLA